MEKVVVLGTTGMAGHVISTYLEERGYDVYGMSRSVQNSKKNVAIDATDFDNLGKWLEQVSPDIIINCIGVLNAACDQRPHTAIILNSYLPQWLSFKYKDSRTKIIHLSTDCVFSGATGGYTENSFPDGNTIYDRSKALGEINNNKDLTFRMSIIGPDIDANGIGLFNWFMKQSGTINGYTKALWNGITTIKLANAIECAIKTDLKGLYHLTPNNNISKYNLISLFKDIFEKSDVEIVPYEGYVVNKSLINTRTDFEYIVPDYPEMIKDMKLWIDNHSSLYGDRYQ